MLKDKTEIEIMSKARQKNVRDPKRSREHFVNIFADYKLPIKNEAWYLDMGAGQFDFGEIVRSKGGKAHGLDNDPAVIELAQYKGFGSTLCNLRKFSELEFDQKFDGVFNKFSYNAFWYADNNAAHESFVNKLIDVCDEGSWHWIAPWNGAPKAQNLSSEKIQDVLQLQQNLFLTRGFKVQNLNALQAKKYGIHGAVENNVVFYKNI